MRAPLAGGGWLDFEVRGAGAPLLLLRPLGGNLLSWDRFGDALAERARVIAFDWRGAGASSPAPLPCGTRAMAREACALLDHLGVARADVYGISLGGMAASWLAIDAPERVGRLVLASTLPRGLAVRKGAAGRVFGLARCLARPARDAAACLATRMLSARFRRDHPDAVVRVQALARARPASHRGLLALLGAAAAHDVRARLADVQADTLVLVGDLDPLLTVATQRELLRAVPRATYQDIVDAGHDVSAEAPRATAACVLDFFGSAG